MIYYILEQLQIGKERAVLVGDTPTDIETARNAGIQVIIVTTGVKLGFADFREIRAMQPDLIVPSLPDVVDYLYTG